MRRLEFVRRGELRWAEAPEARVRDAGDAVVRPIASTTCDLDRAIITGATPFVGPFAIGHECVAEVVDVGDDAGTLRRGQHVVVPWHICCGRCARCLRGLTSQCERVPRYAMYGVPLGGDWGGLFDELVRVPWASQALVPLPEGLDPALVASASDNLTDAWRAVGPALRAAPGARVLIMGGTPSTWWPTGRWMRLRSSAARSHGRTPRPRSPSCPASPSCSVAVAEPSHGASSRSLPRRVNQYFFGWDKKPPGSTRMPSPSLRAER